MKKQVVVIHGGDSFNSYKEYLDDLKETRIDIERFGAKRWKDTLDQTLGKSFQVIAPRMPNAGNSRYIEWKIWFRKLFPYLKNGVVLIGHSLGGIFLAKYLSEEKFPKKIGATILVAAPYFHRGRKNLPKDWILPVSLLRFDKQGGKIFLYQSKDDKVVPFADVKRYKKSLPTATERIFTDEGHFSLEKFPEIVRDIKRLEK